MRNYYSETLKEGLQLLYFQADPSKFPEGVGLLEQAVANGEPDAFYFLARCYGWGDGNVKDDERKAKKLSKRGIELGSQLCVLGADRMDILKGDVERAMTGTLEDAYHGVMAMAEDGEPMAQYAIGLFYFWGDMLLHFQKPSREEFLQCEKENAAVALKWFRRSAEQGCIPAFRNAFNSVRNGVNGVEQNLEEALRWAETMDGKVDMRDYYHSFVLEYQKLKRYEDAVRWSERGTREGITTCMVDLGLAYLSGGKGVKEDKAQALEIFKMAAGAGDEYGSYHAGRCAYYGWGCEKNYDEAFFWFNQAYERGHQSAKNFLAQCYFWGRGVETDEKIAVRMMTGLIKEKLEYPKELMGYCCLYGKGIGRDTVRGKRLLEEAAQDNNGLAWKFLGDMYDEGVGGPSDLSLAVSCYQKAAEKGIAEASEALKRYKKSWLGKWKRK